MENMKIRVVFMGSPDFALPSLSALANAFDVVGVVTQPDRPAGRGRHLQAPDVKILAEQLGLPIIQPKTLKARDAVSQLEAWNPDVIVVAAFGQILREDVLSLPKFGCVNVHASMLPRWRGAAPVQAALLQDEVTGVTIMKMDQGLDTGPIISQEKVAIPESMTASELLDQLAQVGADLLIDTLPRYIRGELVPIEQDESRATYAPRLKKEDGKLDFSQPASVLERQVRAYHPWPGTFQFFGDSQLKILQAHAVKFPDVVQGKRYVHEDKPAFGTSEGILVLDEVQLEGKNAVRGEEFLRGAKQWKNEEEI